LRSNIKGYGGETHSTDSQNNDTNAPSGRELYHLQFSNPPPPERLPVRTHPRVLRIISLCKKKCRAACGMQERTASVTANFCCCWC
jgi:hypothetical protein